MPKILHINTVANPLNSVGGIMCAIVNGLKENGWDMKVACGRGSMKFVDFKIGDKLSVATHYGLSLISDSEGKHSKSATRKFLKEIDDWRPDIIHFHNLHGHYINIPTLFEWVIKRDIPTVMTLHDCWWLTGHCSSYTHRDCSPLNRCGSCKYYKSEYPKSIISRSKKNYLWKRTALNSLKNNCLVAPSQWMTDLMSSNGISNRIYTINNGINLNEFRPLNIERTGYLALAARWEPRKGLDAINRFAESGLCDQELTVVGDLMGAKIHSSIRHIPTIKSRVELCHIYNSAKVYLNPSKSETFGMTTIEAMACGTPVIVNAGGALEEICGSQGGLIADMDNPFELSESLKRLDANTCRLAPRQQAEKFSQQMMLKNYQKLYEALMK